MINSNDTILKHTPTQYELMEEAAMESANVTYHFKKEYTLRDKYYPYIVSFLPKTEKLIFRDIIKYEDKNANILNSPYPLITLPFNPYGLDGEVIYNRVHIDPVELKKDMNKVPLPGDLTEKAAFLEMSVVLFLICRYYIAHHEMKKFEQMACYYGYSLYWKAFQSQFPKGLNENVMVYTINNLTYRTLLKKLGSIKELLKYVIVGRFETYREQVADACDEDIRYVLDQCQSDLKSKIVEISKKYYANHQDNNVMMKSSQFIDSEGTQRTDNSSVAATETLAQKYTNEFFMSEVNAKRAKMAATVLSKDVSVNQLIATIEYVKEEIKPATVYEFYASLFYLYLSSDDPKANAETITSMKFLASMRDILKKGNSNDKNIIKVRDLMDEWLQHSSSTYRLSNRDATKTNYRKAVYFYFILCVTNKLV